MISAEVGEENWGSPEKQFKNRAGKELIEAGRKEFAKLGKCEGKERRLRRFISRITQILSDHLRSEIYEKYIFENCILFFLPLCLKNIMWNENIIEQKCKIREKNNIHQRGVRVGEQRKEKSQLLWCSVFSDLVYPIVGLSLALHWLVNAVGDLLDGVVVLAGTEHIDHSVVLCHSQPKWAKCFECHFWSFIQTRGGSLRVWSFIQTPGEYLRVWSFIQIPRSYFPVDSSRLPNVENSKHSAI